MWCGEHQQSMDVFVRKISLIELRVITLSTELSDAEGKEKCMLSLFHNLPDINYYTAVYLLEHLFK